MIGDGLSLEQAPPFRAPLRFFLTAPIFLILALTLILLRDIDILSRWMPEVIGLTHFFTIGFLLMTIVGALTQMLPVLAGITFPSIDRFAYAIHFMLKIGAIFFVTGFIFFKQIWIGLGGTLLFISLLTFFSVSIWRLQKAIPSYTVTGFKLTAINAIVAILIAGHLLHGFSTGNFSPRRLTLLELHIAWAFFGLVITLIMSVSYKVIPMFYVTKDYPRFFTHYALKIIFALLVLLTASIWFAPNWFTGLTKSLLALIVLTFNIETIRRFQTRKRPITDTAILYWKVAMSLSAIASLSYIVSNFYFDSLEIYSSLLWGGSLLSLIFGMLYKIVPFLAWFHMTAKGAKKVPTMRELISDSSSRLQFYIFMISLALFITPYGKILMIVSTIFFLILILKPIMTYRRLVGPF